VNIIVEPSATHNTCSCQGQISYWNRYNGLLDCVQIWYRVSSHHRQMFKVKGQGHSINRRRTGVASGDFKLQCIRNCHVFKLF